MVSRYFEEAFSFGILAAVEGPPRRLIPKQFLVTSLQSIDTVLLLEMRHFIWLLNVLVSYQHWNLKAPWDASRGPT